LNPDTRQEFKDAGPVVWLKASVATIEARLYGDETTADRRPNLTSSGGREEIERLLNEREPIYSDTATLTIQTDEPFPGQAEIPTIDCLVDHVVTALRETLDAASGTGREQSSDKAPEDSSCL
jgi:shikimate kinase